MRVQVNALFEEGITNSETMKKLAFLPVENRSLPEEEEH
jgi:hypothetical protein